MSHPYTAILLDHYRNPRCFGDLPDADVIQEGLNPICGDRIRIALKLEGETIRAAAFRGDACAITIAAASLLMERLAGMSLKDAERLGRDEMLAALQTEIPAARLDCALLPLHALHQGIAGKRGQGTGNRE